MDRFYPLEEPITQSPYQQGADYFPVIRDDSPVELLKLRKSLCEILRFAISVVGMREIQL